MRRRCDTAETKLREQLARAAAAVPTPGGARAVATPSGARAGAVPRARRRSGRPVTRSDSAADANPNRGAGHANPYPRACMSGDAVTRARSSRTMPRSA
jgi:hypothetical protein